MKKELTREDALILMNLVVNRASFLTQRDGAERQVEQLQEIIMKLNGIIFEKPSRLRPKFERE